MQQTRYKVLHIGFGGGIASLIVNLIENKTEDFDFDVMVFSYENEEHLVERLKKAGSNVYVMPRPRIDGYNSYRNYVSKVMADNHYDAVHCHITGWRALSFYRLAKTAGIRKFFLHAHASRYETKFDRSFPVLAISRYINYKCASAFFACSDLAANYMFGKYQERRMTFFIRNGIAKEEYAEEISATQREAYRREFAINPNETVLLHVGRFTPQKNYDFILAFVHALKMRGEKVKLLLLGDGALLDQVKNRCKSMNLQNDVLFLGWRIDVPSIMQFCDLMILPSRYEGLPTVAIECQATGKPMLLSDGITRQCDMGMNLLTFLPNGKTELWIKAFRERKGEIDHSVALAALENNGFTANKAGREYCERLKELIGG